MLEENKAKSRPCHKCIIRLVEITMEKGTRSIRPTSIPRVLFVLQEVPKTQFVYQLHRVGCGILIPRQNWLPVVVKNSPGNDDPAECDYCLVDY